jgi:ABC-2 type transport system permease protein
LLGVVSNVVPLSHYLVMIRGVMLKGAGLAELAPEVVALGVLTFVIGVLAVLGLGRRID